MSRAIRPFAGLILGRPLSDFRAPGRAVHQKFLRSVGTAGGSKSCCDQIAVIGGLPVSVLGMKGGMNSGGVGRCTMQLENAITLSSNASCSPMGTFQNPVRPICSC